MRDDRVYVDFAFRVNRAKAMTRIQTIASNELHKYRTTILLGLEIVNRAGEQFKVGFSFKVGGSVSNEEFERSFCRS